MHLARFQSVQVSVMLANLFEFIGCLEKENKLKVFLDIDVVCFSMRFELY